MLIFPFPKIGALLPSHGLPPFGANITNIAMSEGLCGSSMFGSDRWSVGVTPMTAGKQFVNSILLCRCIFTKYEMCVFSFSCFIMLLVFVPDVRSFNLKEKEN